MTPFAWFWLTLTLFAAGVLPLVRRYFKWLETLKEGPRDLVVGFSLLLAGGVLAGGGWLIQAGCGYLKTHEKPGVAETLPPPKPPPMLPGPGVLDIWILLTEGRFITPKNEVSFNVHFYNRGTTSVLHTKSLARVYHLRQFNQATIDRVVLDRFEGEYAKTAPANDDMSPSNSLYSSPRSGPVIEKNLLAGTERIYVVARAEWIEGGKPGIKTYCAWLQPPDNLLVLDKDLVWHACRPKP